MPDTSLDMDARYSVDGYRGIAFYLVGYATKVEETEYVEDGPNGEPLYFYEVDEVENDSMVRAVMVGDDLEHIVDVRDLTLLADEDYCSVCGQVGCNHNF